MMKSVWKDNNLSVAGGTIGLVNNEVNSGQVNINLEPNGVVEENNNSGQEDNTNARMKPINKGEKAAQENHSTVQDLDNHEVQARWEKRGELSPNSSSSGSERHRKKRKANNIIECEATNNGIYFHKEGMGEEENKGWVKTIIREERPNVIGLQETKCGVVDEVWIEELWGGAREAMGDARFIVVKGEWRGRTCDVYLACIYGPQIGCHKASMWDRLSRLTDRCNRAWCIFGDLNRVRRKEDRMNSQVNDIELDFGPRPFRICNIWLKESDIGHGGGVMENG
ncbi:RNA-directed DNA polymerase, eukaryota, partial [Tanacetum coccineum]